MRRSLAATIVTQATSTVVLLGIPFFLAVFAILFLSRSTEPLWASSRVFLYLWTMFLSLHPFLALGSSEILLSQGQSGLFFPVAQNTLPFIPVFNRNGALQDFMLPQPWLIYTIEAIVLSAVLVFWSIRLLRPLDDRPRRRRRK
jgi:ABC-2 type transport system permease protein